MDPNLFPRPDYEEAWLDAFSNSNNLIAFGPHNQGKSIALKLLANKRPEIAYVKATTLSYALVTKKV